MVMYFTSCDTSTGRPVARRFVQRFDDRDAAPAFVTIAARRPSRLDRVQQIFENPLMPARVADDRRRGLGVLVAVLGRHRRRDFGRRVAHVAADDAILLDAHGPARARHLDAPRIPRIRRRGRFQRADRAVGELQPADDRVFDFDLVHQRAGSGRHAHDVAEPPQQKVDGVDALIHQGAAAVERARAAPFRLRVVLRWTIPLDAGTDQTRLPDHAAVDPLL